jgi:hypothetical protein
MEPGSVFSQSPHRHTSSRLVQFYENHAQPRSFGAPDSPCFLTVLHAGSPTQSIFKAADTLQALIYGSIQLDPFCTSLALPRATTVLDMSSDVTSLYSKNLNALLPFFERPRGTRPIRIQRMFQKLNVEAPPTCALSVHARASDIPIDHLITSPFTFSN